MGGSVRVPKSLQIFAENRVCALSDLTSCALLAFSCHLTVFSSSGANYAGLGGKGNSDYCNLKIERGKKVLADVRM